MGEPLSAERLNKFKTTFESDPRNLLSQLGCATKNPLEFSIDHQVIHNTTTVFNTKVDPVVKPFSDQKQTGRCWIFSLCNTARVPVCTKYELDEFEISQSYLFFWDKFERCNYWLRNIIRSLKEGNKVGSRLFDFLLANVADDGGQWDMLVNLVNKYGMMPKSIYQGSYSAEHSLRLNRILQGKLREFACDLTKLIDNGASDEDLEKTLEDMLQKVYNIISIGLGKIPETFTWSFMDKNKKYQEHGPMTPQQFYQDMVKPVFNVDDMVCLVNDPRHEYGTPLTVDYLGNVVGGKAMLYNNQSIDVLKDAVIKQITNNEPVWFGCMVSKLCSEKCGTLDPKAFNFPLVFGFDIEAKMSKKERLEFADLATSHAMVFSAVHINKENRLEKLLVENSWGEDYGKKGYFVMSEEWFDMFVLEVIIHKKHLDAKIIEDGNKTPTVLPPWDPMGILA